MLPSVGDKSPQISLSRGVVLSQSTFHVVILVICFGSVPWIKLKTLSFSVHAFELYGIVSYRNNVFSQ